MRVLLRAPLRALRLLALLCWSVSGLLVLLTILQYRGVLRPDLLPGLLGRVAAEGSAASPRANVSRLCAVEVEPASLVPAPPSGRPFLGFTIPDGSFLAGERQRFEIVPAWSRVGFDAATPVDTFSAISSDVQGFGEARPADFEAQPCARLVVDTRSLSTGDQDRDRILHDGLQADRHPVIEFSLDSFETEQLDLGSLALRGNARCTMRAFGGERRFTVPVKMRIDAQQRLTMEGEVSLSLAEMGVEVGSTFGIPMISDEITMWFGIRARSTGRAEPSPRGTAGELADAR